MTSGNRAFRGNARSNYVITQPLLSEHFGLGFWRVVLKAGRPRSADLRMASFWGRRTVSPFFFSYQSVLITAYRRGKYDVSITRKTTFAQLRHVIVSTARGCPRVDLSPPVLQRSPKQKKSRKESLAPPLSPTPKPYPQHNRSIRTPNTASVFGLARMIRARLAHRCWYAGQALYGTALDGTCCVPAVVDLGTASRKSFLSIMKLHGGGARRRT
ncbi:hypothetical protein FPV67DRAFT_584692 [Lyophyllum atratum]|nr:hypothetical protein FPV67DRAFT_584692 [Lyophyllum atratum]